MAERMRERRSGATPEVTSPPPEPIQLTVLPAVIGILVIGAIVLAVGFWVDSKRGAEGAAAPLPRITLVEPPPGAEVISPIPVVFEVPARLRWVAGGWQVGRLHLHAAVNESELMPAARDIEPLGQNRYRWTLPPLPAGEHTLRLFWSGPDHRPIEEGASESVTVQAR